MDTNKRLLLAAVISFLFFFAYDYFYYSDTAKAQQVNQANIEKTVETQQNVQVSQNSAPAVKESGESSKISAPVTADTTIIATVNLKDAHFKIDSLGRIHNANVDEKGRSERLSLFNTDYVKPWEVRFADATINDEAFKVQYTASAQNIEVFDGKKELVLTQKLKNFTVKKTITFYPKGNYDLKITTGTKDDFFITPGFRPDTQIDMITIHGLLVQEFDDTIEIVEDGKATGHESFRHAKIVSGFDRYYSTLFYDFDKNFDVWVNKVNEEEPLAFVKSNNGSVELKGYIGPKNVQRLKSIDPRLVSAVEYGMFTFLATPLFDVLSFINDFTGNWGWSIIIFITLVRIVLFPITHKGMVSMAKLKDISPKMKEIQAKYKGDPQKLQLHMMELYKKHGANPMGGCLPFLLQIPIFFAIYRVLSNAIELRGAEWLYVTDLSAMDPYYVLPILMGVSMYFQQKISPTTITDPVQAKMFKLLPVIFTFFFFTFPAGLVLYWFSNNIFSTV